MNTSMQGLHLVDSGERWITDNDNKNYEYAECENKESDETDVLWKVLKAFNKNKLNGG